MLILFSFNDSRRNFQWKGFTLDWYPKLLTNDEVLDALFVTLRLAAVAVVVSVILGTLLGLALARLRFRGRAATETLLLVPMVTPEIVMGLSLLVFFSQLFGGRGSFLQLAVAHITFCISYVAIVVRARAAGMDPRLEEAARDLGASALGAFRYVTLPLILPAVLSGALLAFALSFDDYVVTTFNAGVGLVDAAALHLRQGEVRGHAGDQRDLDDHRGHHGRGDPGGVAPGPAPGEPGGERRGLSRQRGAAFARAAPCRAVRVVLVPLAPFVPFVPFVPSAPRILFVVWTGASPRSRRTRVVRNGSPT